MADDSTPADETNRRTSGHWDVTRGGTDGARTVTYRMRRRDGRPHLFGAFLLLFGVVFLLGNLHIIDARSVFRLFWPTAILVWGLSSLITGRGDRFIGGMAVILGALLLADTYFGWPIRAWGIFWPLVMIAFGARILLRGGRRHRSSDDGPAPGGASPSGGTSPGGGTSAGSPGTDGPAATGFATSSVADASATLKEFAVMSHVRHDNVSQAFKGGDVTALMGGVELDLRGCRMADGEAHLDVFTVMGGVECRIPRDWVVESNVSLIMAGLDNRTSPPVEGGSKRFIVEGTALMGGVTITN